MRKSSETVLKLDYTFLILKLFNFNRPTYNFSTLSLVVTALGSDTFLWEDFIIAIIMKMGAMLMSANGLQSLGPPPAASVFIKIILGGFWQIWIFPPIIFLIKVKANISSQESITEPAIFLGQSVKIERKSKGSDSLCVAGAVRPVAWL